MKNKIFLVLMFLNLLIPYVNAFGITSFYYEDHPLILNPGETKDVQLILQNEKSSPPVTLKAELNSDIAVLTGKAIFNLATAENNVPVNVKVTIPETAKIGDQYSVGLTFTTMAKPGNKMLELGTSITKSFPIVVGEIIAKEPEKPVKQVSIEGIGTILIISLLVALILFIIYKRKRK